MSVTCHFLSVIINATGIISLSLSFLDFFKERERREAFSNLGFISPTKVSSTQWSWAFVDVSPRVKQPRREITTRRFCFNQESVHMDLMQRLYTLNFICNFCNVSRLIINQTFFFYIIYLSIKHMRQTKIIYVYLDIDISASFNYYIEYML